MNKKLWYLIPLVLLIIGLLLPAFLNSRHTAGPVPPDQSAVLFDSAGNVGQPPAVLPDSELSSSAGQFNHDSGNGAFAEPDHPQSGTPEATDTKAVELTGATEAPAPDATGQYGNGASTTPAPAPEPATSALTPSAGANDSNLVTCHLAVVGKGGEPLFGPAPVKLSPDTPQGLTALGVLAAAGLTYNTSKRWPDFIETIAGQRNQGQSGWIYQVNGAVPPVAAGKKTVAAGDKIIWWYSGSISDPPPVWEQLVNQAAGNH
ncbi:MAG: DUF4430 domain-containing protein [Desulfotomaculaceae bacterium]|nr:DUF4430 domain-containing protein [Desulfotomaculaceae bacterium]